MRNRHPILAAFIACLFLLYPSNVSADGAQPVTIGGAPSLQLLYAPLALIPANIPKYTIYITSDTTPAQMWTCDPATGTGRKQFIPTPASIGAAPASHTHVPGDIIGLGSAAMMAAAASGATATASQLVNGGDPRLLNPRVPLAHASSHGLGGSDALTLDASQITTGMIAAPRLATGTPSASTYLTGAGTWATFPAIPGGTVTSAAISVPSSIMTATCSPISSSGTFSLSLLPQAGGTVFAAPSGTSGTPTFRALVASDIPALPYLPSSTTLPTMGTLGAVPTTRQIVAGAGLTGGGALSGDVSIALSSPVSVANGGTGSTTAAGAIANLGAVATTDARLTPLTLGTITGTLSIASGGTGASTATAALTNLGAASTTDSRLHDAVYGNVAIPALLVASINLPLTATVTFPAGNKITDTNYMVFFTAVSPTGISANVQPPKVITKTTTGFTFQYISAAVLAAGDLSYDYKAEHR